MTTDQTALVVDGPYSGAKVRLAYPWLATFLGFYADRYIVIDGDMAGRSARIPRKNVRTIKDQQTGGVR